MNGKEKLGYLESCFGPYQSWTEESIFSLQENEELRVYFDSNSTTEMLKKENEEILSMIFCLNVGFRISDSNQRFNDLLSDEKLLDEKSAEVISNSLKEFLSSDEIFDRLNAYQLIFSRIFTDVNMNNDLIKAINFDNLILDVNKLQGIILAVDENEGRYFFLSLIQLIYRLQELVFENTKQNIFIESEAFKEKLEFLSHGVIAFSSEFFKDLEIDDGMLNDD